jgi:hypothetical protein
MFVGCEEANPERVAQDRRLCESGQPHSFFWLPRSGLHTASTAFLGRKCSGWGAISSSLIALSRIQYFLPRNVGNTWQ